MVRPVIRLCDSITMEATRADDIDIRSADDVDDFYITGMAVLPDTRLVIADHRNYKVKVADSRSGQLLGELEVSMYPYDVAVINSRRVAVTLPYEKKIVLIKIADDSYEESEASHGKCRDVTDNPNKEGETLRGRGQCIQAAAEAPGGKCPDEVDYLTKESNIKAGGECYGVASYDDKLWVTFVDPPRLELMDLQGNTIKSIACGSDGNLIFARPIDVSMSTDGDVIYVCDCQQHVLVRLSTTGVVLGAYLDNELKGPMKVCPGRHGNVYVCGFFSCNVHVVTAECERVCVLLRDKDVLDREVYSVCHCPLSDRLFVGLRGSCKVLVFNLTPNKT